jgi:DNA-binding transcriptional MerR regulator
MDVVFIFLSHLVSHYWWFLTSSPLIIESVLNLFFDYENWIEQYVSRQKRKQFTYALSLVGVIVASFLAFQDIYLELQEVRRALAKSQEQLTAKGPEEQARAITQLQERNNQLEQELSAIRRSMQTRRLSPEERKKLTDALALQDGQQFGVIEVTTNTACQECMIYRDDIVRTINSVPGWRARSIIEVNIRADVTGLVIGVRDPNAAPPGADVFGKALKAAELPFTIGAVSYVSPDNFILIIGNKP